MSGSIILILVLMALVLGVLFTGIGGMLIGGKFNEKYGNKLMTARVVLQGLTILVIFILFAAHA